MSEPFLQIREVHKVIRDHPIIRGVSLAARRGEVVALCGGNGAGKSTLIKMVAGILQPTGGRITAGGLTWKEDRRRYVSQIGYMPDDYRFTGSFTALETLTYWASLKGLGRDRAAEALAEVGLDQTGRKSVSSFSKGMRQRLLLAQALLSRPPLLLMDEPTNGLDPFWMDSFMDIVRQAAARGQTVLFSTHQIPIAEALADRIVFLRSGEVAFDGTKEDMTAKYGQGGWQAVYAEVFGLKAQRGSSRPAAL